VYRRYHGWQRIRLELHRFRLYNRWHYKAHNVQEQFQVLLSSRSCLNYLHRLGLVLKHLKKRLIKANAEKWTAFVQEYVALRSEAQSIDM
jgi:transposase